MRWMSCRRRGRRDGFTLIELLIVVAIIGIIAALLVPNFLDTLQKAKQKRTMADARNSGSAMMSWLTDAAQGAAAGASSTFDLSEWTGTSDLEEIRAQLTPRYVQKIPEVDGWKQSFRYAMELENTRSDQLFLVASGGRDGVFESSYSVGAFDPTDYDQDVIWADGHFLRWPERERD